MTDQEKGNTSPSPPSISTISSTPSLSFILTAFTKHQKIYITVLASIASFFSPFSANCYFPAMKLIESDLQIDSNKMYSTITVFMLFQGISPSVWSYWADHRGRRPVYLYNLFLYMLSNIGLALASNYSMLLGFRILQAFGSSSIIAIGSGTIADITTPEERGGYQGWYALGFTLAPAVAPMIGGLISRYLGWRWIFWLLSLTCCVHWVILYFTLPETLMCDQPKPCRGSDAKIPAWGRWWSVLSGQKLGQERSSEDTLQEASYQPEKKIVKVPMTCAQYRDVLVLVFFGSFQYAALYTVITLQPAILRGEGYNLDAWSIGLTYLSMGFGFILGSILQGYTLNKDYMRFGMGPDPNLEYARLRWVWLHAILFNIILVLYGWVAAWQHHLAFLLIGQFLCKFHSIFNALGTLLIDLFPTRSASIQACNTVFRCFFGAFATGTIDPLVNALGYGWSYTLISGILLLSRVLLVFELKYGAVWRKQRELEEIPIRV
ncbi:MFS general substrate transporter [Hesseltinella vesiculosa]|uniref:MFS general substrate transporter n=1 Tax=Hesseltinella vesiculosa TaxID=101127 RepID=A0A1X2GY21_9FUNG|nr:MFS general substrate transporter [Hesseltinella vesiculosa]